MKSLELQKYMKTLDDCGGMVLLSFHSQDNVTFFSPSKFFNVNNAKSRLAYLFYESQMTAWKAVLGSMQVIHACILLLAEGGLKDGCTLAAKKVPSLMFHMDETVPLWSASVRQQLCNMLDAEAHCLEVAWMFELLGLQGRMMLVWSDIGRTDQRCQI
jgi:hypothetical protein